MLARETCATSGKGATGVTREMGKTRGESNLSASRLSRMSRASRFDRLTVLSHVEGRATSVALADCFSILPGQRRKRTQRYTALMSTEPNMTGNPNLKNCQNEMG